MNIFLPTLRPLIIFAATGLAACHNGSPNDLYRISSAAGKAESVFLTRTPDQEAVVAWTEQEESGKTSFFYAVYDDYAKKFSRKIEIPVPDGIATHAEGMPKVALSKDGTVIAAYERGTDEGQ